MSAPLKQPRLPRIERGTLEGASSASSIVRTGSSDENAHLWVVSYADLLMVLLCFFVLFFSTDKTRRDSVIHRILVTTESTSKIFSGASSEKGIKLGDNSAQTQTQPKTLAKTETPSAQSVTHSIAEGLRDLNLKTTHDGESLMIEFPDNSYAEGKAVLSTAQKKLLFNIIARLEPYSKEIDLVFIGHTDAVPVGRAQTKRVMDNIDLSSERAKYAMLGASQMGFPMDHLKIEADASTSRQSRTLSISIIDRGAKP